MKYLSLLVFIFAFSVVNAQPPVCTSDSSDPDGDGFGWESDASCVVASGNGVCIDTPPVGDGWGWDGNASCMVQSIQTHQSIDMSCSINGFTNCLIEVPPIDNTPCTDSTTGITNCLTEVPDISQECVDTVPVGDGWGWNGSSSCRLDNEVVINNPDVMLECLASANELEAENEMLRAQLARLLSNQ